MVGLTSALIASGKMATMPTARPAPHRLLLVLVTWLVGVGLATAVGIGALRMIGDQVTGRATHPLSEVAVDSAAAEAAPSRSADGHASVPPAGGLTSAPKTTPTASPSHRRPSDDADSRSAPPARSGPVRSFPTRGGVVFASCVNDKVMFRYAVPQDGYRSDVSERGPERVEVEFESGTDHVHVAISCLSGVPTLSIQEDAGGGRGTDR